MHWTELLAQRHYAGTATITGDLPCIGCGYNLRGLSTDRACPECGRAASDSLHELARPEVVASALRGVARSFPPLLLLVLACLVVVASWPMVVCAGLLAVASVFRVVAAGRLRHGAALDGLPMVAPRVRLLWWLALAELAAIVALVGVAYWAASPMASPAAPVQQVVGTMTAAWLLLTAAIAATAGWMGLGLATHLECGWLRWELRVQQAVVLIAPPVVGVIAAAALLAAPTWWLPVTFGAGLLALTVVVVVTFVGLSHLANVAEQSGGTRDDVVEGERVSWYRRHGALEGPGEAPPIPLEE